MRDFLLPTTDAGVFVQLAVLLVLWATVLAWRWRRDDGTRLLSFGAGLVLLALMGLRAMH